MASTKIKWFYAVLFVLIIVRCATELRSRGDQWKNILVSDARGYNAYLPTFFIYHDWSYDYLKKHEQPIFGYAACDYIRYINDRPVNQYPIGTALLQTPFFLLAHAYTKVSQGDADGFSKPYQLSVLFAALFYLFAGFYFLVLLLKKYGINDGIAAVTLTVLFFATNLFHYAVIEPGMSHVYSFALVSLFLFTTKSALDEGRFKYILSAVISIALIVIVRPSNILVLLLVPFLAGDFEKLKQFMGSIFMDPKRVAVSAVLFFSVIGLQLYFWHVQTGQWLVYSYQDQRFHFDQPHFWEVLFGFRKGLFIYTPVLLIALTGLIPLYKNSRFAVYSFAAFFLIYFYVTSCWYSWYYGASYGLRPIVDTYAVYGLLLAFLLDYLRNSWVKSLIGYFLLLTLLVINQLQAFQYRAFILDWDKMNFAKYKRVFLKTDWRYYGLYWNTVFFDSVEGETMKTTFTDFAFPVENWQNEGQLSADRFYSAPRSQALFGENTCSATALIAATDDVHDLQSLVIKADFQVFPLNRTDTTYFVVEVDDLSGRSHENQRKPLQELIDLKCRSWNRVQVAFKLKTVVNPGEMIKAYLFHPSGDTLYLDDFGVTLVDAEIW